MSHSISNETSVQVDGLEQVLKDVAAIEGIDQAIHVRLVGNSEIQSLNHRWRDLDKPTDVLTFPSGMPLPFPAGDIVISVDYANSQAKERNVPLQDELIALLVHGVLHLSGYDDETDNDKRAMQRRMNEIGNLIGTPIDAEWTSVLHQDEA